LDGIFGYQADNVVVTNSLFNIVLGLTSAPTFASTDLFASFAGVTLINSYIGLIQQNIFNIDAKGLATASLLLNGVQAVYVDGTSVFTAGKNKLISISDNVFTGINNPSNGVYIGLSFNSASGTLYEETDSAWNTVCDNGIDFFKNGVYLYVAGGNTVSNNKIQRSIDGILLDGFSAAYSTGNDVFSNMITYSSTDGMYATTLTRSNYFHENNLYINTCDIQMATCSPTCMNDYYDNKYSLLC